MGTDKGPGQDRDWIRGRDMGYGNVDTDFAGTEGLIENLFTSYCKKNYLHKNGGEAR